MSCGNWTARRPAFTIAVGPHQIRLTNLDRVYWPADPALQATGADQARPAALLRAGVALHPAASRGSPAHDDSHARRDRRAALLSEALGAGAPGIHRDDHGVLRAQGREPRVSAVQQPADLAVAGAVREPGVSRLAFARQGRGRRGKQEHRLRQLARLRSKARCSTIPTTSYSISTPTSTPGKRPRVPSPSSTR